MEIDKEILEIGDRYFREGKILVFIKMLYLAIEHYKAFIKSRKRTAEERKAKRAFYVQRGKLIMNYLEDLSPDEWERVLKEFHKPFDSWPDDLKNRFGYVVNHQEMFDNMRINGLVKKSKRQIYPFGLQLFKILRANGFISYDEKGTHPNYFMAANFLNKYCEQWDLKETKNHRAQIIRFTDKDIKGYLSCLITAKASRFAAIARAFHVDDTVLSGYKEYKADEESKAA